MKEYPLLIVYVSDSFILFFQKCLAEIQRKLAKHPNRVVRLLLLNAPIRMSAVMLPLLLGYILYPFQFIARHYPCNSQTMILYVSLHIPDIFHIKMSSLISLRRTCDASFTCEGFDASLHPNLLWNSVIFEYSRNILSTKNGIANPNLSFP